MTEGGDATEVNEPVRDRNLTGVVAPSIMPRMNYRTLVSESDFVYESPVKESFEGQPIGNGRMGTLVWTTPTAVCFQINRVDVFAVGKDHRAHQSWPLGPREENVDYCGGCARVTIDLGGPVFEPGGEFEQRLSLFDAHEAIRGHGVEVRCFISSVTDVLVVQVTDRRPAPLPHLAALHLENAHHRAGRRT